MFLRTVFEKNNFLKKNNFLGKTFNDVSFKGSNEDESKNKENKLRRNRSKQGNNDYHRDISNDNTVRNRFQVNNQEKGTEVIEKFKVFYLRDENSPVRFD